jgi:hypothetical protein
LWAIDRYRRQAPELKDRTLRWLHPPDSLEEIPRRETQGRAENEDRHQHDEPRGVGSEGGTKGNQAHAAKPLYQVNPATARQRARECDTTIWKTQTDQPPPADCHGSARETRPARSMAVIPTCAMTVERVALSTAVRGVRTGHGGTMERGRKREQ